MSKKPLDITSAKQKLWELGELSWKLKGRQKEIYSYYIENTKPLSVILCSRRFGKCLHEDTDILTPSGLVKIKDINIGDKVYAYCRETSTTKIVPIKQKFYQGEKEVVELLHNNVVIERATEDHRWLVKTIYKDKYKYQYKQTKDLTPRDRIVREFIKAPGGDVNEPHAYAIGALLGDGCSRQAVNTIHISSENDLIPKKVQKVLNATHLFRQNEKNYTWVISNEKAFKRKGLVYKNPVKCNYYDEWVKGKYAHEKIINLETIRNWDRESLLNLLAGLIDTDGGVQFKNNRLSIEFHSQSLSLVKTVQYLYKFLWQYTSNIHVDNRSKYVNGPCYIIKISCNLYAKNALKELTDYLVVPRKKWKPEYENALENNTRRDCVGITLGQKHKVKTYDIGIDTEDHIYLTGNGLVTHNSFVLSIIATEICLKIPNAIVKYACPQQTMVRTIIRPIMREILQDCPDDLKPEWLAQEKVFRFKNGSEIQIAGTDAGNAENLRGGYAQLCIVDEAAFCDDLDYVVNSILQPTTDTVDGKVILASTPNYKDPNHEFHETFVHPNEAEGNIVKFTVFDSPMLTEDKINKIINRYPGGLENPKFRCEYLVEIPKSSESSIVPEFFENKASIVKSVIEKPPFYDAYVSMDVGFKDLTVALFAVYDFREAKLKIVDELVMNGPEMTTQHLAKRIKEIESIRFLDEETNEVNEPYLRVMDNDLKLINDLSRLHQIQFIPTKKDNRDAAINNLRMWIGNGKIEIHERCKTLIYHLENGQWNKHRTDFRHLKDSPSGEVLGGHADALAAIAYMVRNIVESRNPYPENYGKLRGRNVFSSPTRDEEANGALDWVKTVLNIKK